MSKIKKLKGKPATLNWLSHLHMDKLPQRKLFHVQLSLGVINNDGYNAMVELAGKLGLPLNPLRDVENEDGNIEWITREGKLPRRIQKAYFQKAKVKLTAEQVSEFGNVAQRFLAKANSYFVDFTNKIDWDAGDFGDNGSCFWDDREDAKVIITNASGFAVRLWEQTEKTYRSLARCWAIPQDKKLFIFNAYGADLHTFANVLSAMLKMPISRINLQNNDDTHGLLYVNSGRGYAIGTNDLSHWDFKLDVFWETCENCRNTVTNNDFEYNGYAYCEECYYDLFFPCDKCEDTSSRDDMSEVDGLTVCESCYNDANVCEQCDKHTFDALTDTEDNHSLCDDCVSNHASQCEECGLLYYEIGSLCEDCEKSRRE